MFSQTVFGRKIFLNFILIIFVVFLLSACNKPTFVNLNKNNNIKVSDKPRPGQVAIIDSNIIVTQPLSNDVVSSPIMVTGRAKLLKGLISLRLRDVWDNIIATSTAIVNNDDSNWGQYSARLEFNLPSSQSGWLEVYNQNPTDGSNQDLIRLPIVFKEYQKPKVKFYFSNINEDPGLLDCGKVYPLEREIEADKQLLDSVVDELLTGLTEAEMKAGFITNIPETGLAVQKTEIKDGILYIDFNQALQEGVGGSCRVTAIRAQIVETFMQFQGVDEVVISIDGKTEDILQP